MIDYFLNKFDIVDGKIVYDNVIVDLPFINYILSDKSKYTSAREAGYNDPDNDFLVDDNGHILMNIDYVFINTDVFCKSANHYKKYNTYAFAKPGTEEYKLFYKTETKRRKQGMTAKCKLYFKDIPEYFNPNTNNKRKEELLHDLRITGDYYSFLNYSRMRRSRTPEENEIALKQGKKLNVKIKAFPTFLDGQYWDHKVDEFCILNHFNIVEAKARRKGFSYSKASHSANSINLYKDTSILNIAYDLGFLTDTNALSYMTKINLDWFENNTYWKRGYLKETLDDIELGYKKRTEGNKKFGWLSSVTSYATKVNESAAVGKDASEINYEESGKWPNLSAVVDITTSSAEDGSLTVAIQRMFGTGGTKDANWEAFAKYFYNVASFTAVPMCNVWDDDKMHTSCGFFYPQIWGYFPYVDSDGNSDLIRAYVVDKKLKDKTVKNLSASKANIYIGQRANKPSEAFLNTNENIFSHPALNKKHHELTTNNYYRRDGWIDYEQGIPIFKSNLDFLKDGKQLKEFIETYNFKTGSNVEGADRFYYNPYRDENGNIPSGIYMTTYDTYGIDKNVKELTNKNSLASINTWCIPNKYCPEQANKLIHSYCGRLDTMEEMDLKAFAITEWFNASMVVELDRGTCLASAKKYKKMKLLANDISAYYDPNNRGNNQKGIVVGSKEKKAEMLADLADFLYEKISISDQGIAYYHIDNVNDIAFLSELINFRYGGNYDRISSNALIIPYLRYYQTKSFIKKNSQIKEDGKKKQRLRDLFLNNN